MSRLVLGINAEHGDAAAVLVGDQGILAAVAEERLNRTKHSGGFPALAVREVLRVAGAGLADVSDIAVAHDARANLAAKLAHIARHPTANVPRALRRFRVHRKVASSAELVAEACGARADQVSARFHAIEHHLAHVASAFYTSSFERATGFSVDNTGDFATSMTAACSGARIDVKRRVLWPHSLGVFYTALSQYLGFGLFGEEHKVMGLAASGVNSFAPEMREIIRVDPVRGLELNLQYFRHHQLVDGLIETGLDGGYPQTPRLDGGYPQTPSPEEGRPAGVEVHVPPLWDDAMLTLFGPPRRRGEAITDRDHDLAASLQARFEDIYLALAERAVHDVGDRDVVVAGGSALNAVGNGRMITERVVDRACFHPAAADDGTAAGAALYVHHAVHGAPRAAPLRHAYLGRAWSDAEIEPALGRASVPFQRLGREALLARASIALSQGKIVGWFQGREEWGPRALGNRSILCHPGWPGMKATLNARVKSREPFRPFAPALRADKLSTCFHGSHEVPFMNVVYKVRAEWRERLSAVTHADGTGRVQTVRREDNELFFDLLGEHEKRTGIPALLNTSFNEDEPIVHTPAQAVDCFARTQMDALGIGSFWLEK